MTRRILLSGLGLVIGMAGRPALAQDAPTRAVRFGRPISIPDPAPGGERPPAATTDDGVTPAGLFSRTTTSTSQQVPLQPSLVPGVGPAVPPPPGFADYPAPTGTVPGAIPGYPVTFPNYPVSTPGLGTVVGPTAVTAPNAVLQPLPTPRPLQGGPNVTEMRDGAGQAKPGASYPSLGMGVPVMTAGPGTAPAVGPVPGVPMSGPLPQLDDPLCGGCVPGGGHAGVLGGIFGGGPLAYRSGASRYWTSGEYLLWWTHSTSLPVLATTTTAFGSDAFLGSPGTVPVLGGGSFGQTLHSGLRLGGGWWFDDAHIRGLDSSFFFLGQNSNNAYVNSAQYPVLTRPFFNLNAGTPFGETVAFPGFAAGAVGINLTNSLWGADVNYRRLLLGGPCNPCGGLYGLVGFRYMNFKEELDINEYFTRVGAITPSIGVPGVVGGVVTDRFRTINNFYGGQIGLSGETRRGRWFVNGKATVAFGETFQTAEITGGQNLFTTGGGVIQSPGGLLAVPGANIGRFSQNRFAVLPEAGVNLGYHITPHLRVFAGYNFLYLSSVLRPANVVNTALDVSRIPNFPLVQGATPLPGTPQPTPILRATDFYAQGISFGLSYTW